MAAGHSVIDERNDGNGYCDPGELIDLILTLKNFGDGATGVAATLTSTDPYVMIHSGSADFGDIPLGGVASNDSDPFVVQSSASARRGHTACFTLTVTHPAGQTVSEFRLPIGPREFLVWDASPDGTSGPTMAGLLQTLGYSGGFTPTLDWVDPARYHAIFVSVGIYPSNYLIRNGSPEANTLINHLAGGGAIYLEGGDVWYYDPSIGGYDFRPVFGISSYNDGGGDLHQVVGQAGTFTEGMTFIYGGENDYIDRLNPYGGSQMVLANSSPYYGCVIANDPGGYRTIGASFEFAGLGDALPPSTRLELMQAYMEFLLPVDPQAAPEVSIATFLLSHSRPNPLRRTSELELMLPRAADVRMDLIDAAGRCVQTIAAGRHAAGPHRLQIDGRALNPGIYFLRTRVGTETIARRCVVVG